jgi:hypothetical protein
VKSLLLAGAATATSVLAVTMIFQSRRVERRAATMVTLFVITLPVFALVHLVTPRDLGFLPVWLTEPSRGADLVFGLVLYTAVFLGGVLQLYNLADRGFSLRILIDLDELGPMSVAAVAKAYGAGQGIAWMYGKRLDGLLRQGLVHLDEDVVRLSGSGGRTARVFDGLQRFLRLNHSP